MSRAPLIGIVDYGMGNRRSVEKALAHVGARTLIAAGHDSLRAADGLVLPGVGAFPAAIGRLRDLGLDELMRERVVAGVPVLGICLGMQLAFDHSSELGGADGLGLIPGEVRPLDTRGLKLPHIGWTEVDLTAASTPLLAGLPRSCAFYHVHSLAPVPGEGAEILGVAEYGSPFVSVVARGCFHGVQFHPEKSSHAGLALLGNFARLSAAAREGLALQR